MLLPLGGDLSVPLETVVAVCDLDNTTGSRRTREFLAAADKAGRVVSAGEDLPRSFVVCAGDGETRVFLSSLSPAALRRRASEKFNAFKENFNV